MMRCISKVMLAMLTLSMVIFVLVSDSAVGQAGALDYPNTVWSKTGSVAGKVSKSVMGSGGVPGAYVAIVNASNPGQEYAHTISAADGSYSFTGVRATYSSIQVKGPDGTTGSYTIGRNMYKVMAKMGADGEPRYSCSFGVDVDNAGQTMTSVVLPVEDATSTPTPSASSTATATSHPALNGNSPAPILPAATLTSTQQSPTPVASIAQSPASSALATSGPTPGAGPVDTPASAPDSGGMQLILVLAGLIFIAVIIVAAAIFFIVRFR